MSVKEALLRKRGTPQWDAVLRGTGVIALLAIYPASRMPEVAALAGFVGVTLLLNGPLSPVLPAAYEPVLITMGRLHAPLLIALLGIAAILYVELLNYHLYRAVLLHERMHGFRGNRIVCATLRLFERAPFFCVWLCAWSPLPYWAVRFLAPMSGYPARRYLLATFLGRMPRLWFFAALGPFIPLSTGVLLIMTAVAIVGGVLVVSYGRYRRGVAQPAWVRDGGAPLPEVP
jgi:uncharacterized membrane protein YdjX (TVP38/TMEM64 family)